MENMWFGYGKPKVYYLGLIMLLIIALTSCNSGTEKSTNGGSSVVSNNKNLGRDTWQKPDLVIDQLGDISDKTIADIGAGTGYFTFRMAFKAKKVIAIEIDPDMINLIEVFAENLPVELKDKVEARLVEPSNPGLKPGEADVALIINTIGYITNPTDYLKLLQEQLSDEGIIMIVDFKQRFIPVDAPPMSERISPQEIVNYLSESGFSSIETNTTSLEYQYIITAKK